jgi:hypothetical protein
VKTGQLTPYILLSFLIHAGVLIGARQFLKLPTEELESIELIPVEIVVLREEPPAFEPELASGESIWPKRALQIKSQIITKTSAGPSADTIAKPLPKAVGDEPNVTIAGMATTGFIAETLAGEGAGSKPMLLASKIIPAQVSPVYPSTPAESVRLEVKIPQVLVEAQAELTPADSQKPEKVATPLPGSRPAIEPVFEKPSLASERHEEPRLTLNTNPTLRDVPRVPETEAIAGKPVILTSQFSPAQLSPAAPRESTCEPVLMVSTLQLSSHPSGAQVYVDGMPSGETPLEMDLPIGKHEVRLALPEYYDWKAQIELTEKNQAFPIVFRLLPVESTK